MANSVIDVAKHLLWIESQKGEDSDMTNLKLQKLLYYCQGFSLAINGRPLFNEEIKAWPHGPVVVEAYEQYKKHGRECIPPLEIREESICEDDSALIDEVSEVYGQYSPWRLRDMTHEAGPWKDTAPQGTINLEELKSFFLGYVIEQ